jgi:hypothetical protein
MAVAGGIPALSFAFSFLCVSGDYFNIQNERGILYAGMFKPRIPWDLKGRNHEAFRNGVEEHVREVA